jgi:L-rhamnose mutarotase
MKRYTFVMRIKPELKADYRKAHDEIWPDMAQAIRDAGIRNYTISFLPDGTLFAYLESEDPVKAFEILGKTEVNARWQKAMSRFFVKPGIEVIEEVFHID